MQNKSKKSAMRGGFGACLKRLADIVVALPLALLFAPLSVILTALIFLRDPGNPFYCQHRVGRNGKEFTVLKFRTMKKRADDVEHVLTAEQLEIYRREYKLPDDPRLIGYRRAGDGRCCFGAILRRTSMDELPQLWWNVLLLGNMSLVGPRPILKEELAQHYTAEEQQALLSVKPGLTGYWQAYARNAACYENGERQRMELFYVENRSFLLDLKILFRTVVAVITKTGAK